MLHDSSRIVLGRVNGVFGTRGWLKIYSYTRPRENILAYPLWQLSNDKHWQSFPVIDHRQQGAGLVASLEGISDRDGALSHIGDDIAVARDALPENAAGEYYWADLVGIEVVNVEGISLGTVSRLLATGANDVLVVEGQKERLIPYVQGHHVIDVDLEHGRMTVDWHPDD